MCAKATDDGGKANAMIFQKFHHPPPSGNNLTALKLYPHTLAADADAAAAAAANDLFFFSVFMVYRHITFVLFFFPCVLRFAMCALWTAAATVSGSVYRYHELYSPFYFFFTAATTAAAATSNQSNRTQLRVKPNRWLNQREISKQLIQTH